MMTLANAKEGCLCASTPAPCWFCRNIDDIEKEARDSGKLIEFIELRDGPGPFYLFFDTETTGLPAKDGYRDPTHPLTPYPVEVAAILCHESGVEVARLHCIVKPDGWTIPAEAANLHGITHELALAEGVPMWHAMWEFDRLACKASLMVAHNDSFDRLIVKGAHHRLGVPHRLRHPARFCTMKSTTKLCNIPGPRGAKWPKLGEALKILCGIDHENAHTALADVRGCMSLFFWLKANGHYPPPPRPETAAVLA